jgi:hypothetical protein
MAPLARKIAVAGSDSLCSQCGPVASVMSLVEKQVKPTAAAIVAAVRMR